MNKTIIKVLALTLALLMVLPLAIACKKEEEVLETEAGSVVETESIHAVPPQDLGGKEFEFGVSDWVGYTPLNFIDLYVEAYTGDFVEDAAYDRNFYMQEYFNCTVTQRDIKTADIQSAGTTPCTTTQVGAWIVNYIQDH